MERNTTAVQNAEKWLQQAMEATGECGDLLPILGRGEMYGSLNSYQTCSPLPVRTMNVGCIPGGRIERACSMFCGSGFPAAVR
jgi:hypothetical protein